MSSLQRIELIHDIAQAHPGAGVLSTGHEPDSYTDFLVVDQVAREDFFDELRRDLQRNDIEPTEIVESDDALMIPTQGIGIAYQDADSFYAKVAAIHDGADVDPIVKPWSVGPWLPESFAGDLARSLVIKTGEVDVDSYVQLFHTYPTGLRASLLSTTAQEITSKSDRLKLVGEGLQSHFLMSDVCLAGIRYAHAFDEVYFGGLRYVRATMDELSEQDSRIVRALATGATNYAMAAELLSN